MARSAILLNKKKSGGLNKKRVAAQNVVTLFLF
jgi:hypothetical protein